MIKNTIAAIASLLFFASCSHGQNKTENSTIKISVELPVSQKEINPSFLANRVENIDPNIRSVFQDRSGAYWFGTNTAGVYRYDGKILLQFTEKDGLCNNQVLSVQEDEKGNMWFGTGLFGVSCFDGHTFTTYTRKDKLKYGASGEDLWKSTVDDLWFFAGNGAFRFDGNTLTSLPFAAGSQMGNSAFILSRNSVYSIIKDRRGNVWFGTQAQGVACFNGKSLQWFQDKELAGPAVLGLFEDRNGTVWFGTNGCGLFYFDGKSVRNFSEEKGLLNKEFRKSGKVVPGTLTRIYWINEDNQGNLWIATVDSGVWKYDGKHLTNFTQKDGLTSDDVNTIYKDSAGKLWFGTDTKGIYTFNGKYFEKFSIK